MVSMMNGADNIVGIECSPGSNRNMLQFSVLHIAVKVRQRQLGASGPFRVVIRSNLNQARRIRRQVIDLVEKQQSYSTDFYDIPTRYDAQNDVYVVDVLLNDVGYFEFKARVESTRRDNSWVKWADGSNVGISVTPLAYGRDNSIYCAFIRQFGQNKELEELKDVNLEATIKALESKGAWVIPPGGNFNQFMEQLPFIIEELGMKIIHLLPINPVPVSYGRMGMYGSPYATTDYFGIEHSYGTFSRYKTIEDQFIDMTSTIHGLGAKVFLDMVINHTGWASSIMFTHRHWIKTAADGKIISPGAWGVTWGDLVELDYSHKDLWKYMAEVFLVWCRRGIDGFRLDAGYMIPLEAWQYIISKVRQEFTDTLFLLEGLGGPWETTENLLTHGQMNWAYSELFQNYSREQIVNYLKYAQYVSAGKGTLVHYAETHDNDRLAKKGKVYARMRLYVCAFTSFSGAWGITNGVEWLATEKIDVHRNTALHWGNADNLVSDIATINRILSENPAFWQRDNLDIVDLGTDDVLGFVRSDSSGGNVILGAINLNTEETRRIVCHFTVPELCKLVQGVAPENLVMHELLTDRNKEFDTEEALNSNEALSCELEPGGCVLYRLEDVAKPVDKPQIPAIFDIQAEKTALIYKILLSRFEPYEVGRIDQEKLLRQVTSFRKFIVLVNTVSLQFLIDGNIAEALEKIDSHQVDLHSAVWTFRESAKEYIISGDKWLVVHTFVPCTAYLKTDEGTFSMESIPDREGLGHLSFFPPQPENKYAMLTFNWKIERNRMIQRSWQEEEYPILSVPSARYALRSRKVYPIKLNKKQLRQDYATVLLTNGIGGVCQIPALPGVLNTKYDALLSIALDRNDPADRRVLVKTIRETIQVGQKYFDLDESFFTSFTRYPQPVWEFVYDDGTSHVELERTIFMPRGQNAVAVRYKIKQANKPVTLICKCYVEYRSIHDSFLLDEEDQAKYYHYYRSLRKMQGVEFFPPVEMPVCEKQELRGEPGVDAQGDLSDGGRGGNANDNCNSRKVLSVKIAAKMGEYIEQPHWMFNLDLPLDASRKLEGKTHAFAPGVFSARLTKGQTQLLFMSAEQEDITSISIHKDIMHWNRTLKERINDIPVVAAHRDSFVKMLLSELEQFLVYGDDRWLVVAGYPWLGMRSVDALRCCGGLLAAGREDVVRDVIISAAGSEEGGLLRDWLSGPLGERHNIEASLRLFLVADEYVRLTGESSFWDCGVGKGSSDIGKGDSGAVGGRCLRDVLIGIFESFCEGNAAGIAVDNSSGFVYCPAGFTWMNTTHPQATPRQGYPVEIQALWYEVLGIVGRIYPVGLQRAQELRNLVAEKFPVFFWNQQRSYVADVLLAEKSMPAYRSLPDTALRFNQLQAVLAGLLPQEKAQKVINIITRRLVIPAGVRSLSEDLLGVPLSIISDEGLLMADPRMPYQGRCVGDETHRRIAYHNGTAWCDAYPRFIEAHARAHNFSELAIKQSLAFFEPLWNELTRGAIGTLSEMKDGNYPHHPRGCIAYAPAIAEALRVYLLLKYHHNMPRLSGSDNHSDTGDTSKQVSCERCEE